ncbi:HTTM domain-containing protein [Galbibacter sp.]|uniref:HTTM domain-containing protein n=1 Tax=Galbibacter sp. TaxID=2918471 RepID=UPI003A93E3A9
MLTKFLYTKIDNSSLIVFRVIFGLLIFFESIGAIFTGWVRETLVGPQFTFNFIGLDFLQPLPGNGMYYYFAIMGLFGFFVMIGYRYRWSISVFTLMWAGVYFMQKASYNNHYYLLLLLCLIMMVLPANSYLSVDVKRHPEQQKIWMYSWCKWLIIFQLLLVYTYAAIAKLYPGWLDLSFFKVLMGTKSEYPLVGDLLQKESLHWFLMVSGIVFDLLIIPLLLIKKTRKWAFMAAVVFHLFNSVIFQIGIFPYMSLALCLFFFEPETIRKLFLKQKPLYTATQVEIPSYHRVLLVLCAAYVIIQITLPIRHWFIEQPVLWTEEGHRMSWRMMLRSKGSIIEFKVLNHDTKQLQRVDLSAYLSPKQRRVIGGKPDMIWQFAQRLKKQYNAKGFDVSVFATDSRISINGGPWQEFVDPDVDLAAQPWHYFSHEPWITPYKKASK